MKYLRLKLNLKTGGFFKTFCLDVRSIRTYFGVEGIRVLGFLQSCQVVFQLETILKCIHVYKHNLKVLTEILSGQLDLLKINFSV